jgi:uncharacterized surface protein with fasciclin (FAS1) repeats
MGRPQERPGVNPIMNLLSKAAALATAALVLPVSAQAPTKDIVDTAVGAGSFKTLVALVQQAGLVDTLKSSGPFTVFAPSDEAFAKLDPALVAKVTGDKELLTKVLLYHVVPGKVTAADVVKVRRAPTALTEEHRTAGVAVKVMNGKVTINRSNVVATDVMASNGVIHVIDEVLIPPASFLD